MLENENKLIKKELEVQQGVMIKKETDLEKQLNDYKVQVDALKDKVSDIQNINEHYKMEIKSRNIGVENRKVASETLEKEIQKMKSDFICNECDYKANTLPTFLIHMKKKHTEANNEFKLCKKCEFKSANEDDLKLHISVQHADSQNFSCNECNYSSNKQFDLMLHKSVKHNKHPKKQNVFSSND